jgi:hypothetical protein
LRFYIDYRALNKFIIKNRYSLLLIKEIMNKFGGAKIYTKLNLRNIYYKIRIKNNDKWKTAFRTRYNYYEYIVISFELINVSVTFQAYVNKALRELLDEICVVFIDDILIYNNSEKKYTRHVRQIFN